MNLLQQRHLSQKILIFFLSPLLLVNTGCQMNYYIKSAYNHLSMMSQRKPISEVLKQENLDEKQKAKLEKAIQAHHFAIQKIGLDETKNYTTYVELHRPFVSWVVNAAPRWKLEHHEWSYPFVGKMPYKGFFSEDEAKRERDSLRQKELDAEYRGVSAYSTLGWFQDSVLSSMLRGPEHHLVNTVIHETTHTTIYIKNSADFNERLAMYVGNKGTELFYFERDGEDSPTLRMIRDENADDQLFSQFITKELESLKNWYLLQPREAQIESRRQERFKEIQAKFKLEIMPQLKTKYYQKFHLEELNNARLMVMKTYMQDLQVFDSLFEKCQKEWSCFFKHIRSIEKEKDPENALKKLIL